MFCHAFNRDISHRHFHFRLFSCSFAKEWYGQAVKRTANKPCAAIFHQAEIEDTVQMAATAFRFLCNFLFSRPPIFFKRGGDIFCRCPLALHLQTDAGLSMAGNARLSRPLTAACLFAIFSSEIDLVAFSAFDFVCRGMAEYRVYVIANCLKLSKLFFEYGTVFMLTDSF